MRIAVTIGETKKGEWVKIADPLTDPKEQRVAFKKIVSDGGLFGGEQLKKIVVLDRVVKRRIFDVDAKPKAKANANPKAKA